MFNTLVLSKTNIVRLPIMPVKYIISIYFHCNVSATARCSNCKLIDAFFNVLKLPIYNISLYQVIHTMKQYQRHVQILASINS